MEPNTNATPASALWLVWSALLASLAVYAAIPAVIELPTPDAAPPDTFATAVLGTAAAGAAAASLLLRRLLLQGPAQRRELDPSAPAGRARVFQVSVVLWALSESVGIFGLVLFLLYGKAALLYPFLCVAAALLLYHAPRAGRLVPGHTASELARPDVKIG